jgi:uncharacterized protein
MAETALITGASGGIGEDFARLLAANGRNVVLVARSADKLQALASELSTAHRITAAVVPLDLAEPDAVTRLVRELADRKIIIDILVNNAGFATFGPFAGENPREQMNELNVNVMTLTALTRQLLPGMLERKTGRILNVASTAAFQPGPLMAVYYASKAYVLSFSMALTEETEGSGVTVTCLCPGPTRSGFQQRAHVEKTRLLEVAQMMSSADVARAGYDGMMAGKALVVPGLMNKFGTQILRVSPRRMAAKIVKALHSEH